RRRARELPVAARPPRVDDRHGGPRLRGEVPGGDRRAGRLAGRREAGLEGAPRARARGVPVGAQHAVRRREPRQADPRGVMRARWAIELAAAARAHWTEERTRALTGGKRLAVLPAEAPVLLRALGLLHRDATMPPAQVRKFLQINHVVRVLEPALAALRARH